MVIVYNKYYKRVNIYVMYNDNMISNKIVSK